MTRTTLPEPKTELGKRLREARESKGLSVIQLADLAKLSRPSLYYYEAGERIPTADILERLAILLGKSMDWLMARSTRVKDASGYKPEDIPVIGRARGGRGEFSEDGFPVGEGWRKVTRPFDLKDPNAFGVEVVGNSMEPRYFNKETVVCSPAKGWKSGDFCVVKTTDGEYMIKQVKKTERELILSSLAPGHEVVLLPLDHVAGVYKIAWHKERN